MALTPEQKQALLAAANTVANETEPSANTANRIGTLFARIINALGDGVDVNELKAMFLSKTAADTAAEVITFAKGLISVLQAVFQGGIDVAGGATINGGASIDELEVGTDLAVRGNATVAGILHVVAKLIVAAIEAEDITTGNLTVTGVAHFFQMVIDELTSNKGAIIISHANCKADVVVAGSNYYDVFFRATDADGAAIINSWKANDLAICMAFNGLHTGINNNVSNKYYWRKVTSVASNVTRSDGNVYHRIRLSNSGSNYTGGVWPGTETACAITPEAGDNIVQLGYTGTNDAARRSAIIMSAYKTPDTGLTAPSLAFYQDIKDFNLVSRRKTYIDALGASFIGDFSAGTINGVNISDYITNKIAEAVEEATSDLVLQRLDLSNEMSALGADSTGKTLVQQVLTTEVRMYNGSRLVELTTSDVTAGTIAGISATKSVANGVVTLTWTIPSGRYLTSNSTSSGTLLEKYEATISATKEIDGVSQTYVNTFTTKVVRSGAPGVSPTIYQLLPSVTQVVFSKDSTGQAYSTATPSTVSCGYTATTGNTVTKVSKVASSDTTIGGAYHIYYRYIGQGYSTLEGDSGDIPSTGSSIKGIEFVLSTAASANEVADANIFDMECVPFVKDGLNGESPYVADLDNEMDSVSCDDTGYVVAAQSVTTKLSMYLGTVPKTFTVAVKRNGTAMTLGTASAGVTVTFDSSTKVLTVSYATTAKITGKDVFVITLTETSSNTARDLEFKVNGVTGDTYNLKPSADEISAARDSNGNYLVSNSNYYSLTCGYTKKVNGVVSTPSTDVTAQIDSKYNIYFRRRTRSTQAWDANWYRYTYATYRRYLVVTSGYSTSGLNLNTYDAVEFMISTATSSYVNDTNMTESYNIIDRETVNVLADGMNGNSGQEWKLTDYGSKCMVGFDYKIYIALLVGAWKYTNNAGELQTDTQYIYWRLKYADTSLSGTPRNSTWQRITSATNGIYNASVTLDAVTDSSSVNFYTNILGVELQLRGSASTAETVSNARATMFIDLSLQTGAYFKVYEEEKKIEMKVRDMVTGAENFVRRASLTSLDWIDKEWTRMNTLTTIRSRIASHIFRYTSATNSPKLSGDSNTAYCAILSSYITRAAGGVPSAATISKGVTVTSGSTYTMSIWARKQMYYGNRAFGIGESNMTIVGAKAYNSSGSEDSSVTVSIKNDGHYVEFLPTDDEWHLFVVVMQMTAASVAPWYRVWGSADGTFADWLISRPCLRSGNGINTATYRTYIATSTNLLTNSAFGSTDISKWRVGASVTVDGRTYGYSYNGTAVTTEVLIDYIIDRMWNTSVWKNSLLMAGSVDAVNFSAGETTRTSHARTILQEYTPELGTKLQGKTLCFSTYIKRVVKWGDKSYTAGSSTPQYSLGFGIEGMNISITDKSTEDTSAVTYGNTESYTESSVTWKLVRFATSDDEWHRVWIVFTLDSAAATNGFKLRYRVNISNGVADDWAITKPKLEIGSSPTEWVDYTGEEIKTVLKQAGIDIDAMTVKIHGENIILDGTVTNNNGFWVDKDGMMGAKGGFFSGFIRTLPTFITSENFENMFVYADNDDVDATAIWPWLQLTSDSAGTLVSARLANSPSSRTLDLRKSGSSLVFKHWLSNVFSNTYCNLIHLPFIAHSYGAGALSFEGAYRRHSGGSPASGALTMQELYREYARVRSFVGCSIDIYNVDPNGDDIPIIGVYNQYDCMTVQDPTGLKAETISSNQDMLWKVFSLPYGKMIRLKCARMAQSSLFPGNTNSTEVIYWYIEASGDGFTAAMFNFDETDIIKL